MSYRFKEGEKVGQGVCRIVRDRISSAIKFIDESDGNGESIHGARKDLKKIRAVPRLIRDRLGKAVFRQENNRFREIARALSAQRDAEVLQKILDEFMAAHPEKELSAALKKVQKEVRKRQKEASHHDLKWKSDLKSKLNTARRHMRAWPLGGAKPADLCCGIEKSYKQGQARLSAVELVRSKEKLHGWRKRVKDLWYQLRLLEPMWSKKLANTARQLEKLSDFLGEDHDLAMLEEAAQAAHLSDAEIKILSGAIAIRRKRLQAAALRVGRKLYAEKPGAFARCITHSWKRWQQ